MRTPMLMRGFEESNRTLKIQLKGLHYECAFLMAFFKEGEVDFAELVFSFFLFRLGRASF